MALHWQVSKVNDCKRVCFDEEGEVTVTTRGLVFATMSVGIGSLTKSTVGEFWARLSLYEKLFGPLRLKGDGAEWPYTFEDVQAHIGLETNVQLESRSVWMKRIVGDWMDAELLDANNKVLATIAGGE